MRAGRHGTSMTARGGASAPAARLLAVLMGVALIAAAPAAIAVDAPRPVAPPPAGAPSIRFDTAARDSLMKEIRRYSAMIGDLRDSLDAGRGELKLSDEQKLRLESSIGEITAVVERISRELGRMDFEVRDNTISLLDDAGKGIVITIPENLDEHISQGFQALSEIILAELPDTVRTDARRHLTWLGGKPVPPKSERRIVQGNVVKIGDDLLVPPEEDIRGDVVVVMGDAQILGRVDGNVIVVLGDLQLAASADVSGEVVTIGGGLLREPGASAGSVTVIDPIRARRDLTPVHVLGGGLRGFLLSQTLFVVMLLLALAVVFLAPRRRIDTARAAVASAPVTTLGVGLLASLVAHVLGLVLVAVLVLTVIGIPVALLAWLAAAIFGVAATAVTASVLGEQICRSVGLARPGRLAMVGLGMIALHAVAFIGAVLGLVGGGPVAVIVSAAGLAVKAAAYVLGFGALVTTRLGTAAPKPSSLPASTVELSSE